MTGVAGLRDRVSGNLVKAGVAAVWMYGGRGIGMLWTIALIARLGIGDYGLYAMGFALGAIVAAPLDHPFTVRSIRESEDRFLRERTCRALLGITLLIAAAATMSVDYILWFALAYGGGEIVFNAYKSRSLRVGDPHVVQRLDTLRQTVSIVGASAYLLLASDPTLTIASTIYVIPYLVIAVATLLRCRASVPALPGGPREIAMLFTENLANAVYVQGDVLLIGALTDTRIAGYYSVASVLAWAVASIGLSFGSTYHEKLRAEGGAVTAGPSLRQTYAVGVVAGVLMLGTGVVMLFTPVSYQLSVSVVIMSLFVVQRSANYVFTTILYLQGRDRIRVTAALVLAMAKLALVAALFASGAIGAAVASVVADTLLTVIYLRALYGRRASAPAPVPDVTRSEAAR
ncbi:lipopolysaccharide biosynthesis protein [Williamsia sterculiae]|uniref:Membrane protein involved in the export of O-antigen and teichoic acid n=1 Tax=Williamsia sterculiae TaxID=1344003 RepID=A0A1N7CZW4_9NOCA|nr:hypothetical protein [Williamsia sterculiae]SIR69004.1 hypothetical protein SAMN05445060_0466 [Williamsia sterculiae]